VSDWLTDLPHDDFLTQRNGTFRLDADDTLFYSHRDLGILGFSKTMARPINILDMFLE
jgi:hypothetical protein